MPNQPNYDQIFSQIGEGIKTLAESTVSKYKEEAIREANAVVKDLETDLKKWTGLLAEGKIDSDEFELLVNADKDLVKMKSLQIAGLAQIRVQQFTESVFNLIVNVVLKLVLASV